MIVAAALRVPNGLTFSLPRPARHDAVIHAMVDHGISAKFDRAEQGFLDDAGGFLGRRDAFLHALACGQIREEDDGRKVLVSEDLW